MVLVTGVARWGAVFWEEKLRFFLKCATSVTLEKPGVLYPRSCHINRNAEQRSTIKKKISVEVSLIASLTAAQARDVFKSIRRWNKTKQKRVHTLLPLSDLWWSGATVTTVKSSFSIVGGLFSLQPQEASSCQHVFFHQKDIKQRDDRFSCCFCSHCIVDNKQLISGVHLKTPAPMRIWEANQKERKTYKKEMWPI